MKKFCSQSLRRAKTDKIDVALHAKRNLFASKM